MGREELDFFGVSDESETRPDPASRETEKLDNAMTATTTVKAPQKNALLRKHADKGLLYRLFSLRHEFCPICQATPDLEDMNLLSMTNSGSGIYRYISKMRSSTHITRRMLQMGAPPLWLYVCKSCHQRVVPAKRRPSNDALVATYGVSFDEWQGQVDALAVQTLLPSYLLRGGVIALPMLALGIASEHAPMPVPGMILEEWYANLSPSIQDKTHERMRLINHHTDGIVPHGSGAAIRLANTLEARLTEHTPNSPITTRYISELQEFERNSPLALRSVTRQTLIEHYTKGKSACQDCGLADLEALRIVCTGGEALEIRRSCATSYRRLLVRKLAQAEYPGDVSIFCPDCHNEYMRTQYTQKPEWDETTEEYK